MNKQQKETKIFFEKDVKNWSKKSNFKNAKVFNTIHERNLYVLNLIRKYNLKKHLDVGCGPGDLAFESSKLTKKTIGIDFAKNMTNLAKIKFKRKNLVYLNKSFFSFKPEISFDCISANGFIEYLSINQILNFFKYSYKYLDKGGLISVSSRNRLFNLFSLNEFTIKEISLKSFKSFLNESIRLNFSKNIHSFLTGSKKKISKIQYKQPHTGINVKLRHQFSPDQLANVLSNFGFKVLDLQPINFHPVPPSIYSLSKEFKTFSNKIFFESYLSKCSKLSFIPFSSSFVIVGKKK